MDKSKSYVVATHNRVYGIPNALRDFLNSQKVKETIFIAHPLDKVGGESFIEAYINGKKVSYNEINRTQKLSFFNFFLDILLNIFWILKQNKSYDVFIAVDNLNALSGLILKFFGRTKKVIFYALDFSDNRLGNYILNWLYHNIEKFAVLHSDEIWNTSVGITYAREKYLNIDSKKYPQKIVPTGIWSGIVKRETFKNINQQQLFFIGHLLEKQGIQKVLEAIPLVIKEIKDFKFVIVGGGEYEFNLKQKVKDLKIDKYVDFEGIIQDHYDVYKLMKVSAVGVATYKPSKDQRDNFTYFGDPGKIKDYMNMGLPVILTDVSYNAKLLDQEKCAILVEYSNKSIANAIIKLMSDQKILKEYRENAIKQSKEYDWNKIFMKALN